MASSVWELAPKKRCRTGQSPRRHARAKEVTPESRGRADTPKQSSFPRLVCRCTSPPRALPSRTRIARRRRRRRRRNGSALEAGEVRAPRAIVEVVSQTDPAVAVGGPAEIAGDGPSRRFRSAAQAAPAAEAPTQLRLADTRRRRVRVRAVAGAGRRERRRPPWRRRRRHGRHRAVFSAGRRLGRRRRHDRGPWDAGVSSFPRVRLPAVSTRENRGGRPWDRRG